MKDILNAPGIGMPGHVEFTNFYTRAVLVLNHLVRNIGELKEATVQVMSSKEPVEGGVSRWVVKGITEREVNIGDTFEEMKVEAAIPINNSGKKWVVLGNNAAKREPDNQLIADQKKLLEEIATSGKYAPQTGRELLKFVNENNSITNLRLLQLNSDNFASYKNSLQELYAEAFSQYPYDVVQTIEDSLNSNSSNVFVVAVGDIGGVRDRVLSVTGAEMLEIEGITVAEVGDSAALNETSGLGALLKRFLFQTMYDSGSLPSFMFTDSRISQNGAVIKANRRAGFNVNSQIILPNHTAISSTTDSGNVMQMHRMDNPELTFPTENMTMTFADHNYIEKLLENDGRIPVLQ